MKRVYDTGSGNRTRDPLVGGERSHHCTNPAPKTDQQTLTLSTLAIDTSADINSFFKHLVVKISCNFIENGTYLFINSVPN